MKISHCLLSLSLLALATQSIARQSFWEHGSDNPLITPPTGMLATVGQCIASAARVYDVPEALLYAIGMAESRMNPSARHYNQNPKSEDIGLMQINSRWLKTLEKQGVTRSDLLDHCVSIHVGAWVLKGNMIRYGETWRAVGAYNASSRRPDLREAYVKKIQKILRNYGLMEGGA